MNVVKQEDYALVFMCELAKQHKRQLVPLSKISHNHGISLLYLKKIARMLRMAGLIQSKEGIYGGYALLAHPTNVSVWDVMTAVSGKRKKMPETLKDICPLYSACLPQHIKKIIANSLAQSFAKISLQSLIMYEK